MVDERTAEGRERNNEILEGTEERRKRNLREEMEKESGKAFSVRGRECDG